MDAARRTPALGRRTRCVSAGAGAAWNAADSGRRDATAPALDPFFAAVSVASQAAWLGAMAAFTFLPLMQELQLMSYLWLAAAIPLAAVRER